MKTGAQLIAEERERGVKQEGWTAKHDDGHTSRELARAAQTYVDHYVGRAGLIEMKIITPANYRKETIMSWGDRWPFTKSWWRPKDPVTTLVKAGALIAAEIDRLQRAQQPNPPAQDGQGRMKARKQDKAEVQAAALGVVVSWLRSESHLDGQNENPRDIAWALQAQERIAMFIELEAMKLRLKPKTLSRHQP